MSKLNANSLKRFDAITMIRHYGTVAFGVVMFIVFSVLCKSFCTWDNLMIMLRSMSMVCFRERYTSADRRAFITRVSKTRLPKYSGTVVITDTSFPKK